MDMVHSQVAHQIKVLINKEWATQVEELAWLIKDNLSCKHVVLSIEETLIDFLQNDTSPDGVLELEPMSSYHRMLLHRLADIYGFAHESVGEGDDRHLVLERCPDSSIPCVLVSDILWQYDEYQSPATSHQLLKRKEDLPASVISEVGSAVLLLSDLKMKQACFPASAPLEEREAAYLAARERIFSLDESKMKEPFIPKQRNIPVVARRMIAHALGQRISSSSPNEQPTSPNSDVHGSDVLGTAENNEVHSSLGGRAARESVITSGQNSSMHRKTCEGPGSICSVSSGSQSKRKTQNKARAGDISISSNVVQNVSGSKDNLEREHYGAAKRMFAHALGLSSAKKKS
ncbi:uncharacterized protein LOC131246448 isoform X2 [Magnolia sinica]|uniref:uncharacterized protein LOC131246448 isoform X2 n=1 Tax=Magnolia sinica TaxID=86752 RepID=UPI00265B3964|nr:uncharacterized protein LOC131246448 isoform X2 [Magnolia sinica]